MKWYIWAGIGLALMVIGYFGYRMFLKKNDVASTGSNDASTNNGNGSTTTETPEMTVVGGDEDITEPVKVEVA